MNFISTRNASKTFESVSAACAIQRGLSSNGGLFMPSRIPALEAGEIDKIAAMSYPERAAYILAKYLSDYTYEELLADAEAAYAEERFPGGAAPVVKVKEGVYSLELWHGPTCAFKDMALQIMPRLLSRALKKTAEHNTALILVATSGDTGKAALEGYKDVDGIKIIVFYPKNGVSRVQELQMVTQDGNNVMVCPIDGNFDDAQTGVKRMFVNNAFGKSIREDGCILSSANSINFGRLAPQIVYYVSAYCDLVAQGAIKSGDEIDITVPTGNFGNILAAYMAKLMGMPFRRFVCASNQNNILTDFIRTGKYDKGREFMLSISPSMDILISSNLERLLYLLAGDEKTRLWMRALREDGVYEIDAETLAKLQAEFSGYFCSEDDTKATIKRVFDEEKYLMDTHTAVGYNCAEQYMAECDSKVPMLIASTASPYKFASDVYASLTGNKPEDLEALSLLSQISGTEIPAPLAGIGERTVRFDGVCAVADMPEAVSAFAKK